MNWKYNEGKLLSVLQREYGVSPIDALTNYTEDQLQTMVSQLPTERIVNIQPGMTKIQIENRYLEAFMDRDTSKVFGAEDKFKLVEKRAELKVKLKQAKTEEEKDIIQKQIDEVSKAMESKG